MHLVGNNSSMQPTQLWSVGKSTFLHDVVYLWTLFHPCYLFLLWNVVVKWLALCLITIIAAYFLHLYACLTCSSVHASSLHPLLAHHHLFYVDVYCFFFIFDVCYISLWLRFWIVCGLCTYFCLIVFLYHFILAVCLSVFVWFFLLFCSIIVYNIWCGYLM